MKKLALILIVVGFAASIGWGAEPHVYLGLNWVTGEVVRGAGVPGTVPLGGRTAVFFVAASDPLSGTLKLTATTEADGRFTFNPFYNREIPVTFEPNDFAAAVYRGADGYGANQENFALSTLGNKYVRLTLELGAGPGTYEVVDTGWIRETRITRVGSDLRLDWGYDPAPGRGPTAVKIYVRSGAAAAYAADPASFAELIAVPSGTVTYTHAGAARNGNNLYYRIVPEPLPGGTTVLSADNNSITAGKVEVALPANQYVFTALPFQEDNVSLAGILGEQVGSGGEFLWWTGTAYNGATYATAWTGSDRVLRIGEGFILRAPAAASVALVGRFGTLNGTPVRELVGSQYNLIAFPYPTTSLFETMGVTPDNGADLLRWLVATQGYEGATYDGADWVGPAGINNLALAQPRYYRPRSNFTWGITFP
ncbi:MAG: hypothetical protein WC529_05360 [Candidatus Margulisiibacteriota bacterium]